MSAELLLTPAPRRSATPIRPGPGLDSDHFRLDRLARIDQSVEEPHRGVIEAILLQPELRALSKGLTIRIDRMLPVPFRIEPEASVVLRADDLAVPATASVLLRHAFELAIMAPLTAELEVPRRLAARWLAARTAGRYLSGLAEQARSDAEAGVAAALQDCYRLLAGPPESIASTPSADDLATLAGLSGLEQDPPGVLDGPAGRSAWEIFRRAAPVAAPAEQLLVAGGDPRILVDGGSGLNGYGSSPAPRPAVLSFSSSTASTISEQSFASVERLRQSLIEHALYDDLDAIFGAEARRLRREIAAACGITSPGSGEIILTASGTDAEYHALYQAGAATIGPAGLLNVVVAPDETGSGVPLAAAGHHFADQTALGVAVTKGQALAGLGGERIHTVPVAIRNQDGSPRDLEEIDRELEQVVRLGVLGGMKALVHLLDASKTGLGAPSLGAILGLRERFPDQLEVVVDACQMRACGRALSGYLTRSFMVMVTGSKFFTGPPFAGALLVPPRLAAKADQLGPLPEGMSAYCCPHDFPAGWPQSKHASVARATPGPLLRWQAALWERQAFEAVPPPLRDDCLAVLGDTARRAIAASHWLQAVAAPVYDRRRLLPDGGWHDLQSIFPFTVIRRPAAGPSTCFTMAEARVLHQSLLADLSERLGAEASAEDRAILSKACHLGQPVKVPRSGQADSGALRLCLSARLVSRTVLDPLYAPSPEARLERAKRELLGALKKVELIVQQFEQLS